MKLQRIILIALGVSTFILFVFFIASHRNKVSFPAGFQCSGYSRIELGLNEKEGIIIDAVLNLQFNNSVSFFIINGRVLKNSGVTSLKRQIKLKSPEEKKGNGVMFTIDKITKSNLDNTPEEVFDTFLSEFSGDETHLYLSKRKLQDNVFLIGGPFSDVFVCSAY